MWKILGQSVKGVSHERLDIPCQDASSWSHLHVGGDAYAVIAVSDGAGSAAHADVGAALVCESIIHEAVRSLEAQPSLQELAASGEPLLWIEHVRRVLFEAADERGVPPRELACTLLMSVLGEAASLFIQVGDGAIVACQQGRCEPIIWPRSGEYANSTFFLTDDSYRQRVQVCLAGRIDEVAMFTDGLQHLALRYSERAAHTPFFLPMFRALRAAAEPDELETDLRSFLDSDAVNARTDDDKTLILASRLAA